MFDEGGPLVHHVSLRPQIVALHDLDREGRGGEVDHNQIVKLGEGCMCVPDKDANTSPQVSQVVDDGGAQPEETGRVVAHRVFA